MTPVAELEKWQEPKAKVDRFVMRFGKESYRLLAYHAALPLVLTPELVNYLRNEFLRGQDVPWEAEVDLLLSDLCSQVGYELYAMDTQVRAYLLEDMKDSPFWQQRMREVAQVLIGYVNFLSRVSSEQRQQELAAQRLAAMVYLSDETCNQAVQEMAERLKQVSDSAEAGELSERGIRAELARLSRIAQELAPQLQQAPALVEYAQLVQRVLRNPEAVDPVELQQVYQVGDVALTVSSRLVPHGPESVHRPTDLEGFPPLEILDFETGRLVVEPSSPFPPLQTQQLEVVTITLETESEIPETELVPFTFEVATIAPEDFGRWSIREQTRQAQRYIQRLGNGIAIMMVAIPSGSLVMGSPHNEPGRSSSEGPQHDVQVNAFLMGRYPITQVQWKAVAGFPQINRPLNPDPSHFKGDNRPVERVSWHDAVEFCDRLSAHTGRDYRLPTDAEWEYACRAGTTTPFHFGETITTELANYNGEYPYSEGPPGEYRKETTPVDHFKIANAFGLCDMHGNVWEWCLDHWHENYEGAPTDGSAWFSSDESETRRIFRGGSWYTHPEDCRSASRYRGDSDFRDLIIGFRVVCAVRKTL